MYNNYNQYPNPVYNQVATPGVNMNMNVMKKTEIIHVNGENGARVFQMLPNSQALLLDDTAPIVWLAQTDGAGYKTVTPYSITPYQPKPEVTTEELDARLKKLEEAMTNAKSNVTSSKKYSNKQQSDSD